MREYWRLDPEGSLMGSPLEGYLVRRGRYGSVEPVAGRGRYLRSEVLGLELRSERQPGATVLVFRDPLTGEEFDGALAAAEQLRRIAEERASAEANRASAAEERVRALEKQLRKRAAIALRRNASPSHQRQRVLSGQIGSGSHRPSRELLYGSSVNG